tara:strand:- start:288 stop:479 length:192 start_codon:yes stop_codon:yes gene_type:complete
MAAAHAQLQQAMPPGAQFLLEDVPEVTSLGLVLRRRADDGPEVGQVLIKSDGLLSQRRMVTGT